jgi:hypothetical protein
VRNPVKAVLAVLVVVVSAIANDKPVYNDSGFRGLTEPELIRRVFENEQKTIAQFAKREPILETYAQSLDPGTSPEATLDDIYFLGKVSLNPDSFRPGRTQRFAFGASEESRLVRVNTGEHWPLHPDAEVTMLFVDVTDFNSDRYELKIGPLETLGSTPCLRIAVSPRDLKTPGRFVGDIWVETSGFHIVRIRGTSTPRKLNGLEHYFNIYGISPMPIFFHFDSYRQEVMPGVWLPSYTYFDEERLWNAERVKFSTSFRFRGIASVWGYQSDPQATAERRDETDALEQLKASGLVGSPGQVEQWLTGLIREIQSTPLAPAIGCRVLLTMPVELFSVGNTVVVSRGLLNLVPDKAILVVLLAREIAHISLQQSRPRAKLKYQIFDARRAADFPGLGIFYTPAEQAAAQARAAQLLHETEYASALPLADQFLSLLSMYSAHIPHLLRPSFGGALFDKNQVMPQIRSSQPPQLQLRADYAIDAATNAVVLTADTTGTAQPISPLTDRSPQEPITTTRKSH